jgi:hypothetical protein
MNIPILSFLNTFYLTLPMLDKDKKEIHININYDFVNKNLNNILIICLILILSIIIELEMGKLFVLLIFFINILMDNNLINTNLKNKNFKEYLDNKLFYFLGVFLIIQIYLRESKYIKGFLIFLMISVIITLTILEYKTKNPNEIIKYKNNIQNFLISSLITILVLSWAQYGKEPNVKYIKLFCRK